jgi:hypothetical protein
MTSISALVNTEPIRIRAGNFPGMQSATKSRTYQGSLRSHVSLSEGGLSTYEFGTSTWYTTQFFRLKPGAQILLRNPQVRVL